MPTLSFASGQEVFISVCVQACVLDVCAWGCPVTSQYPVPHFSPQPNSVLLRRQPPQPAPGNLCFAVQL